MNQILQNIRDFHIFNNSGSDYLVFLGLLVVFLIIFKIIQKVILKKLYALAKKTKTDLDVTLIEIIRNVKPSFYVFLSFFFALKNLNVSVLVNSIINWLLIIWATYISIIALQRLVDYIFLKKIKTETGNTAQALTTLSTIAKTLLWLVGAMFILSNMGININSVLAGLGIGGIAVALALQNILSDLFSSFAIYFDKPFEVGDFIMVGDQLGVVEKIGIKTTRIKALQGEEIVISNQELTSARIQNFKKLQERRITFSFGVTYGTPNEKLKEIKKIVENIFSDIEETRFDRCHFYRFDESSLFYEVVYFVNSPDFNIYMDIQEKINLSLKLGLEKSGIDMAFPTRTVHVIGSKQS